MNQTLFIIPFYNEGKRISFEEYLQIMGASNEIDFLLINDGSSDDTLDVLNRLSEKLENCTVYSLSQNSGKAEAIRQGILNSEKEYEYIGYLDADFSTPVSEMIKLLNYAKKNRHLNIILGSRVKLLGNQVVRSQARHYFGRIFATIISKVILRVPVYDTQCGAKIIKADIAKKLFEKPFLTRWIFDVEMLLRYKITYPDFLIAVKEFPLETWIEKGNTSIKLKEFLVFPFQILKIYFHYDKRKA
ncbi:dolichyl-phosphate beta-glucosyltransferase [Flavobacterium sp. 28YEA47A]|uniref:glycosyltransferase n=1 Tax=Flavobacterium sp. 28YEA47A TaxID=3156276 RepID=UPI00351571ED